MSSRAVVILLASAALACGPVVAPPETDAGPQALLDAGGRDSGPAPVDAGDPDAGAIEPEVDAGPIVRPTTRGLLVGGPGPAPGGIAGVRFASGLTEGFTDAAGGFAWESGARLHLRIGELELEVDGAATRTVFALAGAPDCAVTPAVRRLVQLVESLDGDRDPVNGITIPEAASAGAGSLTLAQLDDATLDAMVRRLTGQPPVDADAAVHRFITQVDGERWDEVGMQAFDSIDSAQRSQGLASDGTWVWFSWTLGLQRTDFSFQVQVRDNLAIPSEISVFDTHRGDHIGDVDVWNGTLYAPVEDGGSNYAAPRVVLYDALSLDFTGTIFDLPADRLTKGVPWIAIDGPKGVAYVAEWDPTPAILVFSLADFQFQRAIPLSRPLGRIQGAKVYEGALYAHVDDGEKQVLKINLDTGTVLPVHALGRADVEAEAIAFFQIPGERGVMHTTNVTASRDGVELRHQQRVTTPLRATICPGG